MSDIRCTKCKKVLKPSNIFYLELSNKTGHYYMTLKEEPMPSNESQGKFPFGKDCAMNVMHLYRPSVQVVK